MKKKLNYEEAMTRLEQIVDALEAGEIELDEAMKLFEEGAKLSALCYEKLDAAEQKVIDFKTLIARKEEADRAGDVEE